MAEPTRGGDLTLVQLPPPPPRLLLPPANLLLLPRARQPQVVRSGSQLVYLGEEGLGQVLSVPGESYPHLENINFGLKPIGARPCICVDEPCDQFQN